MVICLLEFCRTGGGGGRKREMGTEFEGFRCCYRRSRRSEMSFGVGKGWKGGTEMLMRCRCSHCWEVLEEARL